MRLSAETRGRGDGEKRRHGGHGGFGDFSLWLATAAERIGLWLSGPALHASFPEAKPPELMKWRLAGEAEAHRSAMAASRPWIRT